MGHHIGSDDTFLALIRFAPLLFIALRPTKGCTQERS